MRRPIALLAATAMLAGALVLPSTAAGASALKIVVIVGAVHGQTGSYLERGEAAYQEARKYSSNVVKVFSPCATWSKVKAAISGAAIVIYFGHGNGYPSPYRTSPWPYSQNGFGLNATCNDGHNNTKYYGEYYIAKDADLAANAVVMLHNLCYASGNSEPGYEEPSLSVAKQRVDNYAAGFLAAGARIVIAEGHGSPAYYLWALFNTRQTMDAMWRAAPSYKAHVQSWASSRSPGFTAQIDPDKATPSGFYRSIVGSLSLSTDSLSRLEVTEPQVADPFADPAPDTGGLAPEPALDPSPEPSLAASPAPSQAPASDPGSPEPFAPLPPEPGPS